MDSGSDSAQSSPEKGPSRFEATASSLIAKAARSLAKTFEEDKEKEEPASGDDRDDLEPGEDDGEQEDDEDVWEEDAIVEFWKEFALEERKVVLDKLNMEISEFLTKSVGSRKKLAVDTKQFKKLPEGEEKQKKLGPLLRAYQTEIDCLTKRAQFSEKAFLDMYKSLYDAPDPTWVLEHTVEAMDNVDELREENDRLKRELAQNEKEFAALRNQEITIRKLESMLEEQKKKFQDDLERALLDKESELLEEMDERLEAHKSKDETSKQILDELNVKVQEQQVMIEKYQEEIFELRASIEDSEAARQSETDLLTEELQRANALVSNLQLELKEAKNSSTLVSGDHLSSTFSSLEERKRLEETYEQDRARLMELEDELLRKHEIEEKLRDEIDTMQLSLKTEMEKHDQQVTQLQEMIRELNEEKFALKVQLNARPTNEAFQKLKSQLRMLQAIDSGDLPVRNNTLEEDPAASFEDDSVILFHGRIRKLESTASNLRVELDECKKKYEQVVHEKANVEERLRDQEELVRKLEKGSSLLHVNPNQLQEQYQFERSDSGGNMAVGLLQAATEDISVNGSRLQSHRSSAESMFGIINEQRNEFRKRMLELETERDHLLGQIRDYQQDIESLKADNVNLFEKIKYLQTYSSNNSTNNHERLYSNQHAEVRVSMQGRQQPLQQQQISSGSLNIHEEVGISARNVENKYKKLYEDRINPFNDFSARERRRRYKGLNPAEKITLSLTSFFLSNKYTRSFALVYTLALHMLVFVALFSSAHSSCATGTTNLLLQPQP